MPSNMTVPVGVSEASIQALVIRCGCGDPERIHPDTACPTPLAIEDRGTVSYWHRNPLRRWLFSARKGLHS